MAIYLEKDVLPQALIDKVFAYGNTQTKVATNHTLWPSDVVELSTPIYLIKLESVLREEIRQALMPYLIKHKVETLVVDINYTIGTRFSYIPWHDDARYAFSVTIYLNDVWHSDWGGCLLYEDKEEIKAIYPQYNSAVMFKPPLMHCTVMPTMNAPLRRSLQLFFFSNEHND